MDGVVLNCKRWRNKLYRFAYFDASEGLTSRLNFLSSSFEVGDFISGSFETKKIDAMVTYSPFLYSQGDGLKLALLSSLTSLLRLILPEGHPYPQLFSQTTATLKMLSQPETSAQDFVLAYIDFERFLLEQLGFGLDLDRCAVTGQTNNLIYISPKTGRAVCKTEGQPYHDHLLPFPKLFRKEGHDFGEALKVTGFFIQKHLIPELPFMRRTLVHCAEALECKG